MLVSWRDDCRSRGVPFTPSTWNEPEVLVVRRRCFIQVDLAMSWGVSRLFVEQLAQILLTLKTLGFSIVA